MERNSYRSINTNVTPLERSFLTLFKSSLYMHGRSTIVDVWYVTFPWERNDNVNCTKVSVFKGHNTLTGYRAYSVTSEIRAFEVEKGETILLDFADRIKRLSSKLSGHIEKARKAAAKIPNNFVLRSLYVNDILTCSTNKLSRIVDIKYELSQTKDRYQQTVRIETVEVKSDKIYHFFEKKEAFMNIDEVDLDEAPTYTGLTIMDKELACKIFMEMLTAFEECDKDFLNL